MFGLARDPYSLRARNGVGAKLEFIPTDEGGYEIVESGNWFALPYIGGGVVFVLLSVVSFVGGDFFASLGFGLAAIALTAQGYREMASGRRVQVDIHAIKVVDFDPFVGNREVLMLALDDVELVHCKIVYLSRWSRTLEGVVLSYQGHGFIVLCANKERSKVESYIKNIPLKIPLVRRHSKQTVRTLPFGL